VPVPAFVLEALSAQCRGKGQGDLVFGDGGFLPRPKSDGVWFTSAVKRAGVNVLALQRMLGHTSAKVTLDTYADLFDDDLDAVAVTLHARYSPEIVLKTCSRGAHHDR
jgi:integrase